MDVKEQGSFDIRQNPEIYQRDFGTDEYLCMYAFFNLVPALDFITKNLLRILIRHRDRLGHDRALEFGGGPSLLPSFILAQQVKSVRFSDYVPSNLAAVDDWIKNKSDAHDWTDLFEHVIDEYQKQSGDLSAKRVEWEGKLRKALEHGGLSHCDVNAENCPILDDEPESYDIILSSMCLEEACMTFDIYKNTLKRLYALLKTGGMIMLIHGRNQTYYIQKHRHVTQALDEEKVGKALEEAGFVDIDIKSVTMEEENVADGDGIMAIAAYKSQRTY